MMSASTLTYTPHPWRVALRTTLAVATAATLAVGLAWAALSQGRAFDPRTSSPEDAVILAAAVVGAAVCGYLALVGVLALTAPERSRARRLALRCAPAAWRRLLTAALGASIATAAAGPAMASVTELPAPGGNTAGHAGWVQGPAADAAAHSRPAGDRSAFPAADAAPPGASWLPHGQGDADQSEVGPGDAAPSDAPAASAGTVTVRSGDSLWLITQNVLGPAANTTDVARGWVDLYDLNREVIGSNPDVIHPGAVLTLPSEWRA